MKLMILCIISLLLLSVSPKAQEAPETIFDLRARFESRIDTAFSADDAKELSSRALVIARQSTSRSAFWGAIGFVGELCQATSYQTARELRLTALRELVERPSNSMRWSALVTKRFMPNFGEIEMSVWKEELNAYDELLDHLRNKSADDQVSGELLYAKALARVNINRHWDWLSASAREEAVGLLDSLDVIYGELLCPGEKDRTIRERSNIHYDELKKLHFGAPAPTTSGISLSGKRLDINDYLGEIVVIDFWTSFCQPCLAMVPDIKELLEKVQGQPVLYFGINGDRTQEQGLGTAQRFGMTWQSFWDGPTGPQGPLADSWNVRGWPSVFVIDANGKIRYKLFGAEIPNELEHSIMDLLSEMKD